MRDLTDTITRRTSLTVTKDITYSNAVSWPSDDGSGPTNSFALKSSSLSQSKTEQLDRQ